MRQQTIMTVTNLRQSSHLIRTLDRTEFKVIVEAESDDHDHVSVQTTCAPAEAPPIGSKIRVVTMWGEDLLLAARKRLHEIHHQLMSCDGSDAAVLQLEQESLRRWVGEEKYDLTADPVTGGSE